MQPSKQISSINAQKKQAGITGVVLLALWLTGCGKEPADGPTYNADVAPIMLQHCVACHFSDRDAAPIPLIAYEQVRAKASDILAAIDDGAMPPWLPAPGGHPLVGERRLSSEEKQMIHDWVDRGAIEGPGEAPSMPTMDPSRQRGEPDFYLSFPELKIPAEGPAYYHTVIADIKRLEAPEIIKEIHIEGLPQKQVLHATLRIDGSGSCRAQDLLHPGPGYPGMDFHFAGFPDGYVTHWTPGSSKTSAPQTDRRFEMQPDQDLVLQLCIRPDGQATSFTPAVRFDHADRASELPRLGLNMIQTDIDIAPGQGAYAINESFTIPTDTYLHTLYPHAHHLCRSMVVSADLPNGTSVSLLNIPNWNLRWQDNYVLQEPYLLPAGSVLQMDYTYDNSDTHLHNPNKPPQRMVHGDQLTGERAMLHVQLQAKEAVQSLNLQEAIARYALQKHPHPISHFNFAAVLHQRRNFRAAIDSYQAAITGRPDYAAAHHGLASSLTRLGKLEAAYNALLITVDLDKDNIAAWAEMGSILMAMNQPGDAAQVFDYVLEVDPKNNIARSQLQMLKKLSEQ